MSVATQTFVPGASVAFRAINELSRDINRLRERVDGLVSESEILRDLWLNVGSIRVPTADPAAEVDLGIGVAWEFSDSTDDTVVCRFKLPQDRVNGKGLTFGVGWCTATASAGNCYWQLEYKFDGADSAMNGAADGTLTKVVAASTVAYGLVVTRFDPTPAPKDSDVCVSLRVKRRADEAADTLGEANYLVGMAMQYRSKNLEGGS